MFKNIYNLNIWNALGERERVRESERERDREGERKRETKRERKKES